MFKTSMQMKEYDEFQQIGKEIPFKAPAGFFETISQKTLTKAIIRKQKHKKNNIRRLIYSVAASVALLLFVGFHFLGNSCTDPCPNLIVQETLPVVKPLIREKQDTPKQNMVQLSAKMISIEESGGKLEIQEKNEILRDVLSEMTDDELQQIIVIYKTDLFIN